MVRAKFKVVHIKTNEEMTDVNMVPIYSSDPEHENKLFWEYTPCGELRMTIKNEAASKYFELGKEYYLDFTLAQGCK